MESFSIILSKDRTSGYVRLIGIFCILCNAVIFSQFWFNSISSWERNIGILGFFVCISTLIISSLKRFRIVSHTLAPFISFLLLGVLLIFVRSHYLAVCDILLASAAYYVSRPARIVFSEKGIELPLLFTGFKGWDKFSNVLLKDNVLTLDFRNNKLMQMVIDSALNPSLQEQEFNLFCKNRLQDAMAAD